MPAMSRVPVKRGGFWKEPDALLAEAGAEGEWIAAKIRIIVVALLLITPFYRYIEYPWVGEYLTGLLVTIAGWIAAVIIFVYLKRGNYTQWIGFAFMEMHASQ